MALAFVYFKYYIVIPGLGLWGKILRIAPPPTQTFTNTVNIELCFSYLNL